MINNAYREVAVQTARQIKLVIMLYEGAIRFLRESVSAIQSKDLDRKRQTIDRAVAIVQHLQETLDVDRGGQVAADLNRLYTYISSRILDGSGKLDIASLEEAIKLLSTLLAGWEQAAEKEQERPVSANLVVQRTGTGGFAVHA